MATARPIPSYVVPNQTESLIRFLERLAKTAGKWRVIIEPYKKRRSLDQNAISHAWYLQVSREQKEYSPETVKRICKLDYGIPILRGDSEIFNRFATKAVDSLPLREDKVEAMQFIDVTSIMTKPQFSEYLVTVQQGYAGKVDLRFPNE